MKPRWLGTLCLAVYVAACSAPAGSGGAAGSAVGVDLPVTASSPAHLYTLSLPTGWAATMGTGVKDLDTFAGPGGSLTVGVEARPEGMSLADWPDIYLDQQVSNFPTGCMQGGGSKQVATPVGTEQGRLVTLDCLPGWMLVATHENRLYDFRFTKASGAAPSDPENVLRAIAASVTFQPGALNT